MSPLFSNLEVKAGGDHFNCRYSLRAYHWWAPMRDPGLEYTGFPDANNEVDFQERWRIATYFLGLYFISERLGKRRNIEISSSIPLFFRCRCRENPAFIFWQERPAELVKSHSRWQLWSCSGSGQSLPQHSRVYPNLLEGRPPGLAFRLPTPSPQPSTRGESRDEDSPSRPVSGSPKSQHHMISWRANQEPPGRSLKTVLEVWALGPLKEHHRGRPSRGLCASQTHPTLTSPRGS